MSGTKRLAIAGASNEFMSAKDVLLQLRAAYGNYSLLKASVEELRKCAEKLTDIAASDKDSPLLTEITCDLNDTSALLEFLKYPVQIISRCVAKICEHKQSTAAEVSGYVECCAESMRAVMTVLKTRRNMSIARSGNSSCDAWNTIIDALMTDGFVILSSSVVHKDAITAAAMSTVCAQWIARFVLCKKVEQHMIETAPSMQLRFIFELLGINTGNGDFNSSNSSNSNINMITGSVSLSGDEKESEEDDMIRWGLHPELVDKVSELPMLSRCALLRACLTVFDTSCLLFSPKSSDRDSNGMLSEHSLLMGLAFDSTLAVCYHSLPVVRLYGLQTLEPWFGCLNIAILSLRQQRLQNESNCIDSYNEVVAVVLSKLRTLSSLLTATWCHPSKHVSCYITITIIKSVSDYIVCI